MPKQPNVITEYRNYNLPLHFPALLLSGDYWRISDVPSGKLHFHNCLEIGLCHSDSGYLEFYGERVPFEAGDITIIPRNVPHTTCSSPGCASHWSYLYIDPRQLLRQWLPPAWKNYDLLTYEFRNFKYIFHKDVYPDLYHLLTMAMQELEEQKPEYEITAKGLILALYLNIYRLETMEAEHIPTPEEADLNHKASGMPSTLPIAPALDYIENNYMQQFSIQYLADLCHLSPTHFRRMFHSIMGTSPLDYVNSTRILKSCSLLSYTEDSVLNISEAVGFQSVSSFNRCFVNIMRMTPRDYRKQSRSSNDSSPSQSVVKFNGWMYPE